MEQKLPKQAIDEICDRVTGESSLEAKNISPLMPNTDHLSSRGSHLEASRILLDYMHDVDAAVDVLSRGANFPEAYRIVSLSSRYFR